MGLQRLLGIVDQVADDHDQAAPLQLASDGAEAGGHVGLPGGALLHHGGHQLPQVRAAAARRHEQARLGAEQGQADGVLLANHQVGEAGGQEAGVVPLGQRRRAEAIDAERSSRR